MVCWTCAHPTWFVEDLLTRVHVFVKKRLNCNDRSNHTRVRPTALDEPCLPDPRAGLAKKWREMQ